MKYLLVLFVLMLPAMAQQLVRVDPDCPVNGASFAFTAGGQAGPGPSGFIDNRNTGCSNWTVTYEQVGAGALQIELQSAPDVGGAPGTWVTFAGGTLILGPNPSTGTPYGIIQIAGFAPFVRVKSDSQSANIIGFIFGSRSAAGAGAGAAGCPDPCPVVMNQPANVSATWNSGSGLATLSIPTTDYSNVAVSLVKSGLGSGTFVFEVSPDGTTFYAISLTKLADGSLVSTFAPTTDAYQGFVGGFTSFRVRITGALTLTSSVTVQIAKIAGPAKPGQIVAVDAMNQIINDPIGINVALSDGAANVVTVPASQSATLTDQAYPFLFNGATWDRSLKCPTATPIDDSSMGNTQLIALSGITSIYICKLTLTAAAGVTIQLTQGTGVNCAAGNTALSGIWLNSSAVAEDFLADQSVLVGVSGNAVCLNLSAGTRVTGTIYSTQY